MFVFTIHKKKYRGYSGIGQIGNVPLGKDGIRTTIIISFVFIVVSVSILDKNISKSYYAHNRLERIYDCTIFRILYSASFTIVLEQMVESLKAVAIHITQNHS